MGNKQRLGFDFLVITILIFFTLDLPAETPKRGISKRSSEIAVYERSIILMWSKHCPFCVHVVASYRPFYTYIKRTEIALLSMKALVSVDASASWNDEVDEIKCIKIKLQNENDKNAIYTDREQGTMQIKRGREFAEYFNGNKNYWKWVKGAVSSMRNIRPRNKFHRRLKQYNNKILQVWFCYTSSPSYMN